MPIPDPYAGERFERLRSELTASFVTVCDNLAPTDFVMLIDCMTREEIRGEDAKRWR